MATITSKRFTVLQQVDKTHKARYYGSQQAAFNWLVVNGYVKTDYCTAELTEKGKNELAPMVDQPQPQATPDEATIEGEVSFYADGKPQDGTIISGTDRYGYTIRSVSGKVYDEIKRGDIEPRLADELDDLPFSDVGKDKPGDVVLSIAAYDALLYIHNMGRGSVTYRVCDELTKAGLVVPLYAAKSGDIEGAWFVKIHEAGSEYVKAHLQAEPAVEVEVKPTLNQLIDAALNPDDTEAYETLKSYDWASVPLWVIEIERDDLNAYKWEIWHELRKMDGGILLSNPEAVYKGREVDRAFNLMTILNQAIYSFHKGVGFNVLD